MSFLSTFPKDHNLSLSPRNLTIGHRPYLQLPISLRNPPLNPSVPPPPEPTKIDPDEEPCVKVSNLGSMFIGCESGFVVSEVGAVDVKLVTVGGDGEDGVVESWRNSDVTEIGKGA